MQEVMEAERELDELAAAAQTGFENATAVLMEAQELNSQAQMLENNATSIPLEDIHRMFEEKFQACVLSLLFFRVTG